MPFPYDRHVVSPEAASGNILTSIAELDPNDPVGTTLRAAIGTAIGDFLLDQRQATTVIGADLDLLHDLAADLARGGKRLRPALCVWGWVAASDGGTNNAFDPLPLLRAAASLELLHVSALVHDDVMDGSDLRRGAPAAHRWLEQWHLEQGRVGDPEAFGRAGAILLGDLLLMWSAELLQQSGFSADRLLPAMPIVEAMRTEVTGGQFLDVLAQTAPTSAGVDVDGALRRAERVTEFKSARYTVVRPVQLGARLAGANDDLLAGLEAFALPLGRAFQYRDDLLGVFGDSTVTGKPAGDDLREGKQTVLIAHARGRLSAIGRRELDGSLGRPDLDADGVRRLQEVIMESGAVDEVETMIGRDYNQALAALAQTTITADGRTALTSLARIAVERSS